MRASFLTEQREPSAAAGFLFPRPVCLPNGFAVSISETPSSETVALCVCQPWFYLRLEGLQLFSVVRGGIGLTMRLPQGTPTEGLDTLPRTRALRESTGQQQGVTLGWHRLSSHAQADCRFNCPGSKRAPFFQTCNTIAAILRAKVSRAIAGFIPLDSKF